MWKYIRQYLLFAIIAGLFMMGEVLMDLIQPGIMGRIVDDGVLGVHSRGTPDLHLIWMLGLQMMRTVSGADKVVVLPDGSVAEQGTPGELMDTGTIYPHMVKLQIISQDWGI